MTVKVLEGGYKLTFIHKDRPQNEIELESLGLTKRPSKARVQLLNKALKDIGISGKFANIKIRDGEWDDDWAARVQKRFDSGEWVRPIWDRMGLYYWDHYRGRRTHTIHQPHFLPKNVDEIFFYPTDRARKYDEVDSMKPGKFLKTFVNTNFYTNDIREYTDYLKHKESEILFAFDHDDIYEVYRNEYSTSSCMSGNEAWRARAYGAGDIAIAHIKNSKGTVKARAAVVPEKKWYISFYGTQHYALKANLEAQGYRRRGVWEDVKLLKIAYNNNTYAFPYFDFRYHKMIDLDERTLLLVNEKDMRPRTSGYVKSTDELAFKQR